ncbi:semaphorin-5B-like isoform X1 [Monodon monoceros]|uniref:semaphorin-5B-like isoform X1 n=1 Tax=Monodon monoceros TaxID=40151 RepID=UPI0010F93C13|nr:semaphorin-5B-like isoform X1 [Monodon monoceros]XP_029067205.1 semaphorin-5B-like isoform X1 [Monodon monoceros]
MDPTVMEQKHRCKFAMKDTVQLMASGPLGPVGVPALCPVEEVPDNEQGTALILFPSMEATSVKGVMCRVIFAIVTLVQVSVGNTHGNWSPWSGWGMCSRTCNGGQMRRYRTCDNPRPSNGGRACGGPDSQIQRCNTDICPVDGSWGNWHSWSWCSTSCGGGEKTRKRQCNNPVPSKSGRPCLGDATQVSRCNIQACPGKQLS